MMILRSTFELKSAEFAGKAYYRFPKDLRHYLGSPPNFASSIVSEAYLRAARTLANNPFRRIMNFEAWCWKTVCYVVCDRLGEVFKDRRLQESLEDFNETQQLVDEASLAGVDLEIWLSQLREQGLIKEKELRTLKLRCVEGRAYDEIGAIINTTAANARQIKHRACAKVKQSYEARQQ